MKNSKLTKTILLSQTNLEINTENVFLYNGAEYLKTTDGQGFVIRLDYLSNVRNCFLFGKKLHSITYKSMVEIK